MPLLDVSEVLADPDFNEVLNVIRRQQTIDMHGRAVLTETTFTPYGVVTSGNPDPLLRTVDYEAEKNTIRVHTTFVLIGVQNGVTDYQPDVILWNGNRYLVNKTWDYSKYGAGFIAADCELMQATENTP